ncbi:regulatory protein RecX [Streptobacillus felis]|uniref:Regulatory protein RecX n=1 Tax=Streptobacillus felis TaxID=1384509 RepID=A0A7Z0PHP7_9FUSO|nr:regulatory protein RecX [Streptobacillus felis]NYV28425.1 regulatory protein RecX [Streptobacillus felis]
MKIIDKIHRNKIYFIDGEVVDISLDIKAMFKLIKGMDVTDIYNDIIFESMKNKGIYLISLKDRTSFELKQKLKEKYEKNNHGIINEVIEKFKELELINDREFAIKYIDIYPNVSINKVKSKLMNKGISISIINDVLSELDLNENQKELIQKFINKNKGMDKQKLFKKLINKGFDYTLILKSINYNEVDE